MIYLLQRHPLAAEQFSTWVGSLGSWMLGHHQRSKANRTPKTSVCVFLDRALDTNLAALADMFIWVWRSDNFT
jgi:hypothetical protein